MIKRRAQSTVRWVLIVACIAAGVAGAGWVAWNFLRPELTVTEAVEGPVVQAFYSTGTVEPEREYPVRSNIAGILTEVRVDKGSRVNQGDVLAVVSDPEVIYQRDRARAELQEAMKLADEATSPVLSEYDSSLQATLELLEIARREQDRVQELVGRSAASQIDLDRALDRVKQLWKEAEALKAQKAARRIGLEKEVEVARANLAAAEWNLQQQTLESPIAGVVLDRPTSLGTRVAVNDQIMRIANVEPRNLVMRAAVDEEDVANVDVDQPVRMTLYAFPGQVFSGVVSRIYDQADEARRTFEVDVRLDQPIEKLSPGMTGELAFILAERERATVIPSQALQDGTVWVVQDGQLARTTPQIGIRSVERVEVIDGLPPGARVVIEPVGDMKEGQPVRTEYIDPVTAAGLNKPAVEEQPFKAFD